MNERIRELAKQAGYYLYDLTETHEIKTVETDSADEWITLQKFAELIVRECADVLRQESERLYKLASEEEDEVFAGNFEICAEKCVANEIAIKDHFGVISEQQKKNP